MIENVDCNQLTINTCVNPCSSDEDEGTWYDEKIDIYENFTCNILGDEIEEMKNIIPCHVLVGEDNASVDEISSQISDQDIEDRSSSIISKEFENGLCSVESSCDEDVDGSQTDCSSADYECSYDDDMEIPSSHEDCSDMNANEITCPQVNDPIAFDENS